MQNDQIIANKINQVITEQGKDVLPDFTLHSHKELLNLDIPPMKWLVGMMIPNPGLVVISGKPGSFKTFFALWMGIRVSTNSTLFNGYDESDFCDEEVMRLKEKIPTLFVEEENTQQTMKERVKMFQPIGQQNVSEMFYLIDVGFKFKSEAWRTEVLRIVEEKGIRLLILDPFSSVMGLDNENDNSEVSEVMDIIRKEFVKRDLTVILIHHPSKGDAEAKGIRGAGDILGKCDVHLSLEVENENDKIIRVSYQKMRVADKSKVSDFRMRLAGDGLLGDSHFRYLGAAKNKNIELREEVMQEILKCMINDNQYTRKEIAELCGESTTGKKFSGAWNQLIKDKKVIKDLVLKKFYKALAQ